jgi:hypothetical protein
MTSSGSPSTIQRSVGVEIRLCGGSAKRRWDWIRDLRQGKQALPCRRPAHQWTGTPSLARRRMLREPPLATALGRALTG